MFERIIIVGQQTWKELRHRNAYLLFIMTLVLCFFGPLFIGIKMSSMFGKGSSPLSIILIATKLSIYVGAICSFIFSAGMFEYEVNRRTILAVMIRPIHRYEYMWGRVLGVIFFFSLFVFSVLVASFLAAIILDVSLTSNYLFGIFLRYCSGICFIFIYASLGFFLSSTQVIVSMIFLYVISQLFLNMPSDWNVIITAAKMFFHYLLPLDVDVDMTQNGFMYKKDMYNAFFTMIENLLYGIGCFTIGLFYMQNQDIKLKEE
jgi:ABC-type transport system involved in multi-copper enzyme maturation permease subunit